MYKLTDQSAIIRIQDNTFIPADPANIDYANYLEWIKAGNQPEPSDAPDQNQATISKIDSLERESMLNRGSRELELFLMEDRAAQVAAAKGYPVEAVLGANVYYVKLKALDEQIGALREQIK